MNENGGVPLTGGREPPAPGEPSSHQRVEQSQAVPADPARMPDLRQHEQEGCLQPPTLR